MPSVKQPVFFDTFPIEAHDLYAQTNEYIQNANLPTHPNISRYVLATLSTSSSFLQDIPFFDARTLSWSLFAIPYVLTNLSYYFSNPYFLHMKKSAERLKDFLQRQIPTTSKDEKDSKTLLSLFAIHDKLEQMVLFIESRRTVQKA